MITLGLMGDSGPRAALHYSLAIEESLSWQTQATEVRLMAASRVSAGAAVQPSPLQQGHSWAELAQHLERAGANLLVLCGVEPHRYLSQIDSAIRVPIAHIGDTVAEALNDFGISTIGLLGPRASIEQAYFRERLQRNGIEVLIPALPTRQEIDLWIESELRFGVVDPQAQLRLGQAARELGGRGAEAILLTEPGMREVVLDNGCDLPMFDANCLHAQRVGQLAARLSQLPQRAAPALRV